MNRDYNSGPSLGSILAAALDRDVAWTIEIVPGPGEQTQYQTVYFRRDLERIVGNIVRDLGPNGSFKVTAVTYKVTEGLRGLDTEMNREMVRFLSRNKGKISTIKFIRSMDRSIGLKDAKDFVEYCERGS